MRRALDRVPVWLLLLVALVARPLAAALGIAPVDPPDVSLAFFGFLFSLVGLIWKGVEAGMAATVHFLAWSVSAIWIVLKTLGNGLGAFGQDLLKGFRRAWGFLERLYDKVLVPAWQKVWRLIDRLHAFLDRVFKPVIDLVRRIRAELLALYTKFVRPVLDTIEIVRRLLRLAADLGVEWARTLDQKLGELEDRLYAPFAFLLRKVNEIINLIDRVVTLDGLFQRLALVKSIARDMKFVGNLWWHTFHRKLTPQEELEYNTKPERKAVADVLPELEVFLRTGGGPDRAKIEEAVADLAIRLRRAA